VPAIGPAVKYSASHIAAGWTAPPALGEHSRAILKEWLGIDGRHVGQLVAAGVVRALA
jgi:succinate---hydroxymethylglutarate CoA-transferase